MHSLVRIFRKNIERKGDKGEISTVSLAGSGLKPIAISNYQVPYYVQLKIPSKTIKDF